MTVFTSPTATIEEGASLGDGCTIWDLSQIRTEAVIGAGSTIGRNVFIDHGVVVGERCKIQNNALVYAPARIGAGVFIGPAAILTNDRTPRAVGVWKPDGVIVEDGASLGAGVIVVAGVSIGRWAMAAAGAVVASDVPAFALVAGCPARQIGWVGPAGVRLVPDGHSLRCPITGDVFVEQDGGLEQR